MSTEDKIAEIRREIGGRLRDFQDDDFEGCFCKAMKGVVVFGVPLTEPEIETLSALIHPSEDAGALAALREIFRTKG